MFKMQSLAWHNVYITYTFNYSPVVVTHIIRPHNFFFSLLSLKHILLGSLTIFVLTSMSVPVFTLVLVTELSDILLKWVY